jgi:hypothetical protein
MNTVALADPTAIAHDRIRFALPGDWSTKADGPVLQGSLAGAADGAMVVLGARDMGGKPLAEVFSAAVRSTP